jgi:glycine/D-amino acid oxidase-like deaminating enzyme
MTVDYIIVGLGLAGIAFAEELKVHKKSFVVFDDNSQKSSLVAGGMYNPVVLKRFTPVWNAKEQLDLAIPFYQKLENNFDKKYNYPVDIYRIFKSIEEQNNWFTSCDKLLLQDYMVPSIFKNDNEYINAPFNLGKLTNTGRIDVKELLVDYTNDLIENKILLQEKFNHNKIRFLNNKVVYKGLESDRIIFCEGFGIVQNKYFNYLPMREAKGELLTIHAPKLKVNYLIKSAVFVMPLADDLYKIGATFDWEDKTNNPTLKGRDELETKLKTVINCNYKIVDQTAGIRPTVKDRRPLVGTHPKYKTLSILNGLGTRGVMIAPLMAKKLVKYLEDAVPLDREIDITRFE